MNSNSIIYDFHEGKYGNEGRLLFPLFQKEIKVHIDFDVPFEYAEKCASHLLSLNASVIDGFCESAVKYCESNRTFLELFSVPIPEGVSSRDILQYMSPVSLIVDTKTGDVPGFHMEFQCDWEWDHNLEWTVLGDETIYVGEFADIRPCQRNAENLRDASWNYA